MKRPGRQLFIGLFGWILLASSEADADPLGLSIDAGWRITDRLDNVISGDGTDQLNSSDLVLSRLEVRVRKSVTPNLSGYLRYTGGRFHLQLAPSLERATGVDNTFDFGGSLISAQKGRFTLLTHLGGRVRTWAFQDNVIPAHGNLGLSMGIEPGYGPCSLQVESTLSAMVLFDESSSGTQKDSSILRVRPECRYTRGPVTLALATEFNHTHTEWFGASAIAGQNAWMLDDLELALVLGIGATF